MAEEEGNKYVSDIPVAEAYIEVTVLCVISAVAIAGNVSLWMVILGSRHLRRQPHLLLLLSLSLADLLVSIVSMPITVVSIAQSRWVFSQWTCSMMGFLNMLTLVCSVMSLGLISINRYIKVCHSQRYTKVYTGRNILLMTFGVWCLSALLSSPPLLGWSRYDYLPRQSFCFCDWSLSVSYTFFMVLACFFGPLSMMTVCGVAIWKRFSKSQRRLQMSQTLRPPSEDARPDKLEQQLTKVRAKPDGKKPPNVRRSPLKPRRPVSESGSQSECLPEREDSLVKITLSPSLTEDYRVKDVEVVAADDVSHFCLTTADSDNATTSEPGSLRAVRPSPFNPRAATSSGGGLTPLTVAAVEKRQTERRRGQIKQLVVPLMVVVVVFVLCWMPFCVTMLFSVFAPHKLPRGADMFTLLLGYSNSCFNPIIYGMINKKVNEVYRALWASVCPWCASRFNPNRVKDADLHTAVNFIPRSTD